MAIKFLSGVNIDSNTLFVDDANNRVGIGTASPLSLLHVYGSNPRNLIQDAGAGYPYIQLNNSSGNFYISIDNSSGSGFGAAYGRYLYSEGAYPMIFTTDSAERLRITGAGNVGIGTTSTFGRLQISGTVGNPDLSSATATGVSLVISNNDTGYGTMFATYGNGNGALQQRRTNTNTYYDFLLQPHGGNVGIGTTSPANTLQIGSVGATGYSGNRLAVGDGTNVVALHPGAVSYLTANGDIVVGAGGNTTNQVYVKSGGNVGIGTTAPGAKLDVAGSILASNDVTLADGVLYISRGAGSAYSTRIQTMYEFPYINSYYDAVGDTSWTGQINFRTSANGSAMNTIMVLQNNGNVGIGTTSPGYSLDVAGTSRSDLHIFRSNQSAPTADAFIFRPADNTVALGTANAERMRIDASGNVGIGITSVSARLSIASVNGSNDEKLQRWVYYAPTPNEYYLDLKQTVTSAVVRYNFSMVNAGTAYNDVLVLDRGNVGIGNTDPSQKLHVSGNIRVTGAYYDSNNSSGSSGQVLSSTGSGTDWVSLSEITGVDGTGTANYVPKWLDANTIGNSVIYENGGNIGIGVTDADYPLTVGSINVGGAGANLGIIINSVINTAIPSSSVKAIIGVTNSGFGYSAGSLLLQPRTGVNGVVAIATEGTEKFRVNQDGNVLIGTTTDAGYKLDVNGTGRFTGSITSNASGVGTLLLGSTSGSSQIAGRITATESPSYNSTGKIGFSVTTWGVGTDYGLTEVMAIDMRGADSKAPTIWMNPFGGNVGIGTTSPASIGTGITSLDIQGSNAGGIAFGPSGTKNYIYGASTMYVEAHTTAVFVTSGTEKMRITSGGNVLIGTTTDNGAKLQVAGSVTASANISLGNTSINPVITFTGAPVGGFTNGYISWGGTGVNTTPMLTISTPGSNLEIVTGYNERMVVSSGAGIGIFTNDGSGTYTNRFQLNRNGSINAGAYGSGSITGTPTYNLAVDASGNIIETAGGVVDGSGTANYVTKWQDANTVTNSSITDDGTTVTATATNFVSQSNLGTAYTSFTTSGTTAIFDTITRTGSAIYQIVIVANPNSAGSGSYQDFYYGKVFIGTGYNGSIVAQFINYHQESPMPRGLYGSGGGDLTVTAVMLVSGSEVTEVASGTSYTIRIKIAGYQVAGAGTTVRLQRIM